MSHHQRIILSKRLRLAETSFILGELKRGEAPTYNQGVLEGRSPSYKTHSPSPLKERGTQGVR